MASTDALLAPIKASAFRMPVGPFYKTDGTIITTWAGMDSEISKDGGNYADCSNEATEIQTSGTGYLDLTTSETNCDGFWVKVTITNTDAVPFVAYFSTQRQGSYLRSDLRDIAGSALSTSSAQLGVNVVQLNGQTASASGTVTFPNATLASTTNITAGTITTVTNLTNAASAGDFTATMKTSIGTAVAASAVASVTGNVGGNVTGSVGSVTGLTASNLDAAVSSRMATYVQPTGFLAANFTTGIPVSGTVTLASSQTFNNTGTWTGNLVGTVSTVTTVTGGATSAAQTTAQNSLDFIATKTTSTDNRTQIMEEELDKVAAATYYSATLSGSTLTLADGTVMVTTASGRVTTPP